MWGSGAVRVVAGIAVTVALAGCTGTAHDPGTLTSSSTRPDETTRSTPPGAGAPSVVRVVGKVPGSAGILLGMTDDRRLLMATVAGSATSGTETLRLYDPVTRTSEQVRGPEASATSEVTAATGDTRHVVWVQSPPQDEARPGVDWSMFVYDRATRSTTLLARAPKVAGYTRPPGVPGTTAPVLFEGRVYWTEAHTQPKGIDLPVVEIMSIPVVGGPKRAEVINAWEPSPTTAGLVALRSPALSGKRVGGSFQVLLVSGPQQVSPLYTGTLGDAEAIVSLTASDSGVAWLTQAGFDQPTGVTGSTLHLLVPGSDAAIEEHSSPNEVWGNLICSTSLIGWYDYGGVTSGNQYATSWKAGNPQVLAPASALGDMAVSGDTIAWSIAGPEGQARLAYRLGRAS